MSDTAIEWTDKVWNPVTGCTHAGSPGCDHCYARRLHAQRHRAFREGKLLTDCYRTPFHRVRFHPDRLDQPLRWRKPASIFLCSMGDLFHEDVKPEWIDQILEVVSACHEIDSPGDTIYKGRPVAPHTFLALTKRAERIHPLLYDVTEQCGCRSLGGGDYYPNLYLGLSCSTQAELNAKMPAFLESYPGPKFLSLEPLLGPVDLIKAGLRPEWKKAEGDPPLQPLGTNIDAVIVGGETGPGARPMHPDWARAVRDQCAAAGAPFFFKQWGEWATPSRWRVLCCEEEGGNWGVLPSGKPFYPDREPKIQQHIWSYKEARNDDEWLSVRVGKRRAGRLLDGRQHNDLPWRTASR